MEKEFRRLKANKIWNRKTFKKLFKFWNLRIYITWNLRLKARNKIIIIPKFSVGDEIKTCNEESLTITKIDDKGYWSDDLFICGFDDIAKWELVEHKPIDKVEHKFGIGDWVVFNNKHQSIYQVEKIEDGYYILRHTHGGTFRVCVLHDESLRLWTIQDAKDGDVLTCYSNIKEQPIEQTGIIKQYVGRHCGCSNSFKAHFGVDWDNNIVIEGYMGCSNIYPSTKEQRDALMKAMTDAGYTFDFEKKELKKLKC